MFDNTHAHITTWVVAIILFLCSGRASHEQVMIKGNENCTYDLTIILLRSSL